MGSGLDKRGELDEWLRMRCCRSIRLVESGESDCIILTGGVHYKKYGFAIHRAHRYVSQCMRTWKLRGEVAIPSDFQDFPWTSRGDVRMAVAEMRRRGRTSAFVVTERIHWERLGPIFQEAAPEMTFTFVSSGAKTPWFYRWKEKLGRFVRRRFGEQSRTMRCMRLAWPYVAPLFGFNDARKGRNKDKMLD